jgi:hypothetical protein
VDTLRQADADVKIQAAQVLLPNLPLNSLDMGLVLKDGALSVKPLKAVLGKGSMDGHLSLQSQGKVASLTIVLKINQLDISLLTKEVKGTEGFEGNLEVDIDLRTRGASIAGLMRGLTGKTVLVMGKGRVDNKYIDILGGDLSSSLFRLLNPFRNETQYTSINCFVSGFDIKDGVASTIAGPYFFQKINGKPYGTIKTTWKTCCRKAEVIDAHVHDIRHKAITDMGKRGYTIQQIAKIAGHSQILTTMRYTHLRAEDTRKALESLGRRNKSEVGELEIIKPGRFEETAV